MIGVDDSDGVVYRGQKLTIIECQGAKDSLLDAISGENPSKQESLKRSMLLQIQRLADIGQLSRRHFPQEDCLPYPDNNKHFYAFKRIPLRAYCWYSRKYQHVVFISHYILKRQDKLSPRDTRIVHSNYKRIEVGSDER